ncbi:replication restart DNA helicase PriA [Lishizhenia tianjinensis]|uniref:Replication restart protein PriA n=1 Tax=Lishizhenia tianjinensis TaxID=477690 RepID=A0A1I6YSC7_9FLAO|nr:primosomal protein N' [Lishizhenia tianjinensis]SFT53324.1 replication restart DNA helicase PriA [Lishizhenia tianjinensis]
MAERKTFFVEVLLPLALNKSFTYRVPFELNEHVKPGIRVVVPFGKAKLFTGLITKVHEDVPSYQAKYIEHVLDENPIITGNQFKLWNWIADYYMAPLGDVMNAALPSNFKLASETKIILHPEFNKNILDRLDDREYQIYEALEIQEELDLKEISEIVGIKTIQPIINKLIGYKVLLTKEELRHKFTPKTALFIRLTDEYAQQDKLEAYLQELSDAKGKDKQLQAILTYLKLGGLKGNKAEFILRKRLESEGASVSSLNTLEKNGVLFSDRLEISRLGEADDETKQRKALSEDQQRALDEVRTSFTDKDVCLLHGVTGSGKTEIYVELIQEQLDAGKQVLFLLPEIALTTQLINRLSAYFGDLVGVYHSKFNQNERVEIWNALLNNNPTKFRIILGARSSLFLPFRDLGLIIIDEEHESSFKQYDPSPRYNARDSAIVLGALHKTKVLLGSATPAFETYFNAQEGKFGLVELNKRFGDVQMPEILTANLKKEKIQKTMNMHFSSFLVQHMEEALQNGEQIILFQNRRGYNPIWNCEICGWTPKCKNCDVSLTYHKHGNALKCHYCSYYAAPMGSCPKCSSNRLKMVGFGTEKIEDDLSVLFPKAKVQRLDLDTTRQKNSYSEIISNFENREIDILVGTQMVTKGLDFDNVSLVGILDADLMLNRADFRAFERSYHLMSQVAGRAGRKSKRGKVIIQTHDVDHWVIRHVIEHDYNGFYKNEIMERKNYLYPPFYKIINFTLKHRKEQDLEAMAADFGRRLYNVFGSRILGPEAPAIKRIQNNYIQVVKLKMEREASPKKVKAKITEIIDKFYSEPMHKSVRINIDVDPM